VRHSICNAFDRSQAELSVRHDAPSRTHFPAGGRVTLDLLNAAGAFAAERFHPCTGETKQARPVREGSPAVLGSPFRKGDAVLYLKRTRCWSTPIGPEGAVNGGDERYDAVRLGRETPGPIATGANKERAFSVMEGRNLSRHGLYHQKPSHSTCP
jgi:hypothetical protein